ncbi:MAG: DNA polymerase III subunit beta [Gammaproteobacteria bacterium]
MKINITRDSLLPCLQAINNVVERRQTLPILGNVMVVAEDGELTLTATDMEVELVSKIDANVESNGTTTVPARKLFDICKALPSDAEIRIEQAEERVKIQSKRSRFLLTTLPSPEFPSIGNISTLTSFSLKKDVLRSLVEGTQFAMAHQDVRYYLNGLLFELSENKIRTVATDGHRLAMCDREVELSVDAHRQLIVPRKGVVEIVRLLSSPDEDINIEISDNHMKLSVTGQTLITKLVDGRFPDYERVIPRAGDKHVFADREILKAGLARASILSNEKFRGVRIILGENNLTAIAHNPEQEEAEEEIEVQYNGESMEIGFNVSYLLDVLNVLDSEQVRLDFIDSNSSCLIKNPEDEAAQYVIMPMRL